MKRALIMIAILLLSFVAMSTIAHAETPKKETSKAKVVVENGQKKLVLDTGRKGGMSFNNVSSGDIELLSDAALWKILDSLVTAPWGGDAVRVKDTRGYNVDIQKAMVNNEVGVFFLSGTKCVSITGKELTKLK